MTRLTKKISFCKTSIMPFIPSCCFFLQCKIKLKWNWNRCPNKRRHLVTSFPVSFCFHSTVLHDRFYCALKRSFRTIRSSPSFVLPRFEDLCPASSSAKEKPAACRLENLTQLVQIQLFRSIWFFSVTLFPWFRSFRVFTTSG